jgi:hypothetical protein
MEDESTASLLPPCCGFKRADDWGPSGPVVSDSPEEEAETDKVQTCL